MKLKNILVIGMLLIVLQIGILSAQEQEIIVGSQETGELIDICALKDSPIGCGSDLSLSGENLKISKEGDISFTGEGGKLILNQGKENEIVLEGTKGVEINPITGKINFVGEGGEISINGNKFSNIDSGDIVLNQSTGEIIESKFIINKYGEYVFGNQKVEAPAGSTITFKDGKINLEIPEGEELKNFPSLVDSEKSGYLTKITGKNVKLPNGHVLNSGILNFEKGNVFVKAGDEAIIDKAKILKSNNDINLYFDEVFDPLKHIDENYYFYNGKEMALHSIKDGKVDIEYQAGNEFFNMNKRKYNKKEVGYLSKFEELIKFEEVDEAEGWIKDEYGFAYKIVPDEKDLLKFLVSNGDELKVGERTEKDPLFVGEDKKLIPLIEHNRVENGKTIIQSGRNTFVLSDKLNWDVKKFQDEKGFIEMYQGKYQSVPFQLKSNSILEGKDYQLRIGSNNQFAFISPDEKDAKVIYNKYGIGVGKYQEDLQTIDQLNAKYMGKSFVLSKPYIQARDGKIELRSKEYTEPSPYMVQLVDQWLEENPKASLNFEFTDKGSFVFGSESGTIVLGEEVIDPSLAYKSSLVNQLNGNPDPLQQISHEYTHTQDLFIGLEKDNSKQMDLAEAETKRIMNNPENPLYLEIKEKVESKVIPFIEQKSKISILQDTANILEIKKKKENLEDYEWSIFRVAKSSVSDCQIYGHIDDCYEYLLNENPDIKEYYPKIKDYLLKHEIEKSIENHLFNDFYSPLTDINTKLNQDPNTASLGSFYQKIIENKEQTLIKDEQFKQGVGGIASSIKDIRGNLNKEDQKTAEDWLKLIEASSDKQIFFEHLYKMGFFVERTQDNSLKEKYIQLANIIDEKTGMKMYGFVQKSGEAYELPAIYAGEPIELRKQKLNQGTPAQKEVYYKLTQLAFDSDKMDVKEYKQLMGKNYCKKPNCCDKKCILYKLNCEGAC